MARRTKQYCLFVDLKSAFDGINKDKLIVKMLTGGYCPTLVNAIQNLLHDTKVEVQGVTIPTEKGSPQGSCLSPELFNIYLADLCR